MTDKTFKAGLQPGTVALLAGIVVVAVLYTAFPNHRYLTDGLQAATSLRDSPGWVVHPNHVMYPLLPQAVHHLMGCRSSGLDELDILIAWSMLAGLVACIGLVAALRSASVSIPAALVGLGLFAFMKGIWWFSVIPSPSSAALAPMVLVLAASAFVMHRCPNGPSPAQTSAIALLVCLAILTSQINAVLLLPAGYVVLQGDIPARRKVGNLLAFLAIVAIVVCGVLVLAAVTLGEVRSPGEFLRWQRSYVYDSRWWVQGPLDALRRNWEGSSEVFVAFPVRHDGLFGDWAEGFGTLYWFKRLAVRAGQAFVLVFFLVETIRAVAGWIRARGLKPVQAIGLLAALPLMIFTSVWTPETIHYRILYIPGFILFLVPSLERCYSLDNFRFRRAWPVVLLVAALFSVNFSNQFLPQSDPTKNPDFWDIQVLQEFSGPDDLIIYSGSGGGAIHARYAEYFLGCDTMRVHELVPMFRSNPQDVLADFRARWDAGARLLIHEDALYSEEDLEAMNRAYGTDIRPGELLDLMQTWTDLIGLYAMAHLKTYYRFRPKDLIPSEIPISEEVPGEGETPVEPQVQHF